MTARGMSKLLKSLNVECAAMPAAKIRMSILPKCSSVNLMTASQSASLVASAILYLTYSFPYCLAHSSLNSTNLLFSLRPETTTGHWRCAYLSARFHPRPLDAPKITTTLPCLKSTLCVHFYTLGTPPILFDVF